jgi:hypothetical protein
VPRADAAALAAPDAAPDTDEAVLAAAPAPRAAPLTARAALGNPHRAFRAFRAMGALRTLNVPAVGLALASVTSAAFAHLLSDRGIELTLAVAGPTCVLGMLWALLLRSPRTVGKTTFRMGWVASVPLAMLNAGSAFGILCALTKQHVTPMGGALLAATFGVIVWGPALALTLLCFGAPIGWAQRLAAKGLAGEERGEWIVGTVCALMSVVGIALSFALAPPHDAGAWVAQALGVLGLLSGGAAALLAGERELRRRRFVAAAEAGKVPGFRVDATTEGKVLVRVVAQGKGYRVADLEEEVFELSEAGVAVRAKARALVEGDPTRS